MINWIYAAIEDIVIVDYDAEYADYDNPKGAIYGTVYKIIAEAPDGCRRILALPFKNKLEAEIYAFLIGGTDTAESDDFYDTFPQYGSVAYQFYESDFVEFERKNEQFFY